MNRRNTPRNVFSLEVSSGGFSTGAFAGVDALEGSLEVAAEFGCEALGAASMLAEGSAMVVDLCVCFARCKGEGLACGLRGLPSFNAEVSQRSSQSGSRCRPPS